MGPEKDYDFYKQKVMNEDGKLERLAKFKGKVVLLNLWATWCAPCVDELPAFAGLQKKYETMGLLVVAASEDATGPSSVRNYFDRHNIELPVYMDHEGTMFSDLEVYGLPMTYVIGRDGTLLEVVRGNKKWLEPEWTAKVEGWLEQAAE